MRLLDGGLAGEEQTGLAVVIGEQLRASATGFAALGSGEGLESDRRVLAGSPLLATPRVRLVVRPAHRVVHRHVPVLLKGRERAFRRIDREMGEVRPAQSLQLGVEVREVPALQQRIVGEVDARHHVVRAERDLLGLGEEVVDGPVEHETPDPTDRKDLFGNQLRRVEHVELELIGERLVEDLHTELPLREVAGLDRVPQIATVEIGIGAVDLHRLVPHDRLHAELRLPVKLDEARLPCAVDEAEGVDTEPFHEPVRPRDRPIRHHPHQHVGGLRHQRDEVREVVVRGGCLWEPSVWLVLHRMHEVGELHRILHEEDRDVVAHEIPVALLRVELHGEAAHVAGEVGRALVARDRREAHEDRGAFARPLEEVRAGQVGQRFERLEEAVCTVATSVNDALWDAFVVEVEHLLAQYEVVQQRRSAVADLQRVLIVGDRRPLGGGERGVAPSTGLMRLATGPDGERGWIARAGASRSTLAGWPRWHGSPFIVVVRGCWQSARDLPIPPVPQTVPTSPRRVNLFETCC